MLDPTEAAKLLVGVLFPALPFLKKLGEKMPEELGVDAVKALGKSTWNQAMGIWSKLNPKIQQKPGVQQAIQRAVNRPDDISKMSLVSELRDILEANPKFTEELLLFIQSSQGEQRDKVDRSTHIQSGGVSVKGDFNNEGGSFVGGNQYNYQED